MWIKNKADSIHDNLILIRSPSLDSDYAAAWSWCKGTSGQNATEYSNKTIHKAIVTKLQLYHQTHPRIADNLLAAKAPTLTNAAVPKGTIQLKTTRTLLTQRPHESVRQAIIGMLPHENVWCAITRSHNKSYLMHSKGHANNTEWIKWQVNDQALDVSYSRRPSQSPQPVWSSWYWHFFRRCNADF